MQLSAFGITTGYGNAAPSDGHDTSCMHFEKFITFCRSCTNSRRQQDQQNTIPRNIPYICEASMANLKEVSVDALRIVGGEAA